MEKRNGQLPSRGEALQFLIEELAELMDALYDHEETFYSEDPSLAQGVAEHVLKEMGDVIFTISGYCLVQNWHLEGAYDEVCKSNMTKAPAEEGKVQKGPDYVAPLMGQFIG